MHYSVIYYSHHAIPYILHPHDLINFITGTSYLLLPPSSLSTLSMNISDFLNPSVEDILCEVPSVRLLVLLPHIKSTQLSRREADFWKGHSHISKASCVTSETVLSILHIWSHFIFIPPSVWKQISQARSLHIFIRLEIGIKHLLFVRHRTEGWGSEDEKRCWARVGNTDPQTS